MHTCQCLQGIRRTLQTLTDFRLSFLATDKYEADKDKYDIRALATVHNI